MITIVKAMLILLVDSASYSKSGTDHTKLPYCGNTGRVFFISIAQLGTNCCFYIHPTVIIKHIFCISVLITDVQTLNIYIYIYSSSSSI